MNNVALAFFEESWSQSGNRVDARWRLHAVDYNLGMHTFDGELHHASVIGLVLIGGGLAAIGVSGAGSLYDEATRARIMTAVPKVRSNGETEGIWIFDSATGDVLYFENVSEPRKVKVHRVEQKTR